MEDCMIDDVDRWPDLDPYEEEYDGRLDFSGKTS